MPYLLCPICNNDLIKSQDQKSYICKNNHSFDISKKGDINLLLPNKKHSAIPGDNIDSLKSRREFLEKGYYSHLSNKINELALSLLVTKQNVSIADCCCGEGYYTNRLVKALQSDNKKVSGIAFDISKQGVKMSSSKLSPLEFFTGSVFSIPVKENSINLALHCFAPYCDSQISKILSKNGYLLGVIPGKNHLVELKDIVYDHTLVNDEEGYTSQELTLVDKVTVSKVISLESNSDIKALFSMTPYYYKTPKEFIKRLDSVDKLNTTAEFIIQIFQKL